MDQPETQSAEDFEAQKIAVKMLAELGLPPDATTGQIRIALMENHGRLSFEQRLAWLPFIQTNAGMESPEYQEYLQRCSCRKDTADDTNACLDKLI